MWLVAGRWFSLSTPSSSTNKTDRHNIAEILLKVASNTTNQPNIINIYSMFALNEIWYLILGKIIHVKWPNSLLKHRYCEALKLLIDESWRHNNGITQLCLEILEFDKTWPGFPTSYVVVFFFSMFNDLRRWVIVRCVVISGIADHHYSNFLFTIYFNHIM